MKHAICLMVLVVGCGGSSGGGKPAEPTPTQTPATQPVTTEIPAAAGAVAKAGVLPPEITALPTAAPESMAEKPRAASAEAAPAAPHATIIGQAWYAGPACAQATWPPQCNGAYRATWVWIWSHAAGTWLRSAQTDNDGRYTFIVEPGWYTIMFQTGFADGWWYSKINVPPFETVTANLVVDYGVR